MRIKLKRIPARLIEDLRTVNLLRNWPGVLRAKLLHRTIGKLTLRNGRQIEAPAEIDLLFLFHEIWLEQIYEMPGYAISEGNKVIDIGGNIGTFAVYALGKARDVEIHTYEPFAQNVEYLRHNTAGDPRVRIYQQAIAAKAGKRMLHVDESWVLHSLQAEGERGPGVEVDCTTLDEAVERIGWCDLLKIDCEGGEYEIFRDTSPKTMGRIRRIICEYHNTSDGSGDELRALFEPYNFTVDVYKPFDHNTGLICARNTA